MNKLIENSISKFGPMLHQYKRAVSGAQDQEKFKKEVEDRAEKYIKYFGDYWWEKLITIEAAGLEPESTCLDISTGVGMLPYMLRQLGHECDATECDSKYQIDSWDNIEGYKIYKDMLGVKTTEFNVHENATFSGTFPRKRYDCIFSTRIVWSTGFHCKKLKLSFDHLWQYSDRLVLHFNNYWHPDDVPNRPHLAMLHAHASKIQATTGMICILDKHNNTVHEYSD